MNEKRQLTYATTMMNQMLEFCDNYFKAASINMI